MMEQTYVFERYAQEGLYAIPAKALLGQDGSKKVHGTMPHAYGVTAIRSGSDWKALKERIMEYIHEKQFNFVAIKTGSISDVYVLDVDVKDKEEEDILAGMPFWKSLIDKHGEPDTLKATTPSGGFHYYFSFSGTLKDGLRSGKNFVGVDVDGQVYGIDGRGEGGIAFAPPSSLGEGIKYEWNVSPKRINISTAPTWVIELINGCARRAGRNGQINTQGAFQAMQSSKLEKHDELLLHSSFADEADLNKDSINTRDARAYEKKIADAMMKLLSDAGLDENVQFFGKVSSRGPFGSLYSFVCKDPRMCIHGHCHNGSNNLTLIKRGWVVLYRCFGSECSEKPLVEVGTLSLADSLLDANPTKLHPTFDHSVFPNNCKVLSEIERQYSVDLIKRNVMQRYRGMAAIFSAIYAVDGHILAEGKKLPVLELTTLAVRWFLSCAISFLEPHFENIEMVRESPIDGIQGQNLEAYEGIWTMGLHSRSFGIRTSKMGNPTIERRREESMPASVGARLNHFTFPFESDSTCQLIDLTRGSEVRICLEHVLNSLQIQEDLDALMDQVNPYLFACANGTLETTTGQLLAPHPAQLCSRALKVAFRGMPQGESRFAKFLLACLNDDRQVLD
jgi:hypothetical protein